jgi:hypothetical protein
MVGEAINRLIKHHHKSLKERVRGSLFLHSCQRQQRIYRTEKPMLAFFLEKVFT